MTNYEVIWQDPDGLNKSSSKLSSTLETYTASAGQGLISGQQYTVFVIAHVKLTDPDSNLTLESLSRTERLGMFC